MKKLLVLALALILALGCVSALAEEELPESLDIRVLVWKYDDTYGSTVRAGHGKVAAEYYSEPKWASTIQLTMYDAADDIGQADRAGHHGLLGQRLRLRHHQPGGSLQRRCS